MTWCWGSVLKAPVKRESRVRCFRVWDPRLCLRTFASRRKHRLPDLFPLFLSVKVSSWFRKTRFIHGPLWAIAGLFLNNRSETAFKTSPWFIDTWKVNQVGLFPFLINTSPACPAHRQLPNYQLSNRIRTTFQNLTCFIDPVAAKLAPSSPTEQIWSAWVWLKCLAETNARWNLLPLYKVLRSHKSPTPERIVCGTAQ